MGLYLVRTQIDNIMLIFYHFKYRSPEVYTFFFENMDQSFTHELLKTNSRVPRKYDKYLKKHNAITAQASTIFRNYWDAIIKNLVIYYSLLLFIPFVVLMQYRYYYLIPIIFIHMLGVLYKRYFKQYDKGFYTLLMLAVIFKDARY